VNPEELKNAWFKLDTIGKELVQRYDPLQRAFGEHLQLVANACFQLGKALDGDVAPGTADAEIKAVLGTTRSLQAAANEAKRAQERLRRALIDAEGELEAMTPAQLEAEQERFLAHLRRVIPGAEAGS
jgi:hypothetical protein